MGFSLHSRSFLCVFVTRGSFPFNVLRKTFATFSTTNMTPTANKESENGATESPPEILNKVHLPYPKGPYGVSMVDVLSYGTGKEGQFIRLLFPCDRKDVWNVQAEWPTWLPAEKYVDGFAAYVNVWPSVLRVIMAITSGTQYLPLFTEEPVAAKGPLDNGKKFPVVVFSHGLGTCRASYSIVCYELASQGFIVAAVEHRDGSACMTPQAVKEQVEPHLNTTNETSDNNNEEPLSSLWTNPGLTWMPYTRPGPNLKEQDLRTAQLKQRAQECEQCVDFLEHLDTGKLNQDDFYSPRPKSKQWDVLSGLKGRIDLDRIMLAGHSMGGVTTMKALARDNKFRCGVALDPWMYALRLEADEVFPKMGTKPLLSITMEAFQNLPNQKVLGKLLSLSSPEAYREIFTIRGSVHESPSDAPFMSRTYLSRIISKYLIGPPSTTDREVIMDINNALMLRFSSKFLSLPKSFSEAETLLEQQKELLREGLIMDISKK